MTLFFKLNLDLAFDTHRGWCRPSKTHTHTNTRAKKLQRPENGAERERKKERGRGNEKLVDFPVARGQKRKYIVQNRSRTLNFLKGSPNFESESFSLFVSELHKLIKVSWVSKQASHLCVRGGGFQHITLISSSKDISSIQSSKLGYITIGFCHRTHWFCSQYFVSFIWVCEMSPDCISHIKCALCLRWIDEDIIDGWTREKHTVYCEWNRILLPMGSNKRHSKHQINQHLNIRWGCELCMMLRLIPYEKFPIYIMVVEPMFWYKVSY